MGAIRPVAVRLSENVRDRQDRASYVRHYDDNLSKSFPYFIRGTPDLIGQLSNALSKGFSQDGYGPFWPSFASVNDGRDGKVLWVSDSGLVCLRIKFHNTYNFDVQEKDTHGNN